MKFGVSIGNVADVDIAVEAEASGFDFCWVWDSPMLRSNLWSVLTLLADRTSNIEIGPGVTVPALRLAPVTANCIATINLLAPGRTFLGLGTGNTAMRTMGQLPMKLADFADHIRVVKGLLSGQPTEYEANGRRQDIEYQSLELGYLNLDDPIPIHVGGFGPKAQALAGELGDGLITGFPRGGTLPEIRANLERGAAVSGNDLTDFETVALVNVLVLRAGETLASDRAVEEVGSSVLVSLHYLYDRFLEVGVEPPPYAEPFWEEYVAFRQERDRERDHTKAHSSHYGSLDPLEARFVTPELIRAFALAGQPDDIKEQLRQLEADGLTAINFIPPAGRERELYGEFARDIVRSY